MATTISVLMTVYPGDAPDQFLLAGRSIAAQTHRPDEWVLIADGPLPSPLLAAFQTILAEAEAVGITVKPRYLPVNQGLAAALNAGSDLLTGAWIARMDADDYAVPTRLEKQLAYTLQHPDTDVLFSAQGEFTDDPDQLCAIKTVPTEHAAIVRGLAWRNIISHPTLFIRRELWQQMGGYRAVPYLEDYDLYLRLRKQGARFAAIAAPLVQVRVSAEQRKRRGGLRYALTEWGFRYGLYRQGMLRFHEWLVGSVAYFLFRLTPPETKKYLYRIVRRRPVVSL